MSKFILKPFLSFPDITVKGEFFPEKTFFKINYQVLGHLSQIKIPSYLLNRQRVDKLWENTCFELFIKPNKSLEYFEFNFSPDNTWNMFHFDDYRKNKQESHSVEPEITTTLNKNYFSLSVSLPLISGCQLGISCVLAGNDKTRSYWALEHNGDKPDFHISDGFIQI